MTRLLAALVLLIGVQTADAYIVTIDASEYSVGDDISRATPGAKLSTITNVGSELLYLPVSIVSDTLTPYVGIEGGVFGHGPMNNVRDSEFTAGNHASYCLEGGLFCDDYEDHDFAAFHVQFAQPTDFVQIHASWFEAWLDNAYLSAYDSSGHLLARCYGGNKRIATYLPGGALSGPCSEITARIGCDPDDPPVRCNFSHNFAISLPTEQIAYLIYGGEGGSGNPSIIDRLSYRVSVPEPSTLALMLAVVFGCRLARRRC